ncbi:Integrase, catalytic core protein [Phytophthora cinnamomi]|uniref:Integrase, catalytic core protein n=1 Tax=Phytophthora cinnamomi TaxID=4785 RepID=UPI0035598F65|nr:Integrase, catalytic core protein [Phytophthora cinnamomi]
MREDEITFVGWKGDVSRSDACGQVTICATDAISSSEVLLELEDARYTSGGTTNLLSLGCLEQCGWVPSYLDAVRPDYRFMFLDRGDVRLKLPKRNGHYWLQTKWAGADASMWMVTTTKQQSPLMKWHVKFSHLNMQALKQVVLKEMVDGMQPLKLDDFKEPIGLETVGGKRYFQLIQDEALRYKWCYLLEHKSEATRNVMNLILRLEKEHVVNRVAFDQGGDFVIKRMHSLLADHGIVLRPTNLYTPEENSSVEKQIGNLMNKVRAIRERTGLPEFLWGEILMYVVKVGVTRDV